MAYNNPEEHVLFSPVQVGSAALAHRVVMAPMTRRRAADNFVPTPRMVEYYAQRAVVPGTLLISEATSTSNRSGAVPNTPGLFTDEQIEAWKPITQAVHGRGSFIYVQLWMCGRATRPAAVKLGAKAVSASDIPWGPEAPVPRPLTEEEIFQSVEDFRQASANAIQAGFDGVELHGANGYLLDQFTQDISNKRQDRWGGSIENRSRFPVLVAKTVADEIGPERVGYRVSPWSRHHGMRMDDPVPQFVDLVTKLKQLRLGYLHIIESRVQANADVAEGLGTEPVDFLAAIWGTTSPIIFAGGYNADNSRQKAEDEKSKGREALIAFGRTFVSNPDLPQRIQGWFPVAPYDRDLFYKVESEDGYTDYPVLEGSQKGEVKHGKEHVWPASIPGYVEIR